MANDNENLEIKKAPKEVSQEDMKEISGGLCSGTIKKKESCVFCAEESNRKKIYMPQ